MYTDEDVAAALEIVLASANDTVQQIQAQHDPESKESKEVEVYRAGVYGAAKVLAVILPVVRMQREESE